MIKKILLLAAILSVLLFNGPKAYMASNPDSMLLSAPIAPVSGRKSEANFYNLLNNSGREYRGWINDGRNYIKRREFEQAILAFRKAIRLQPASEEARFLLAWAYEKRGAEGLPGDTTDWDSLAVKEYTAAVELADHLPSRFNLAIIHRKHHRFEEARRHLEHILLINSQNAIGRKASVELASLFEQDMRPRSISSKIGGTVRND